MRWNRSWTAFALLLALCGLGSSQARADAPLEQVLHWQFLDPGVRSLLELVSRSIHFSTEIGSSESSTEETTSWVVTRNPVSFVPSRRLVISGPLPTTSSAAAALNDSLRQSLVKAVAEVTLKNWLIQYVNENPAAYELWQDRDSPEFQELLALCTQMLQREAAGEPRAKAKEAVLKTSAQKASPEARKLLASLKRRPVAIEPTFDDLVTKLKSYRLRDDLSVPRSAAPLVHAEQALNNLNFTNSPVTISTLPASFMPNERNIFELPFILLKPSEVEALGTDFPPVSKDPSGDYRFFIHPQNLKFYANLIATHPLHYEGYVATPLSSTRSMIAWNVADPEHTVFPIKTGIDAQIGRALRNMPGSEALQATMVNDGLRRIPPDYLKSIRLQPFYETAAIVPKGYSSSIIFKDPEAVVDSGAPYLPLFSLYAAPDGKDSTLLSQFAKKANMDPADYAQREILHPLIQSLAKLYVDYGFMPEPHGQNLLVKADPATGKILGFGFRDFSGVAIDSELRKIRGLSNDFIESGRAQAPDLFKSEYHYDRGVTYLNDRGLFHLQSLVTDFANALGLPPDKAWADSLETLKADLATAIGIDRLPDEAQLASSVRDGVRNKLSGSAAKCVAAGLAAGVSGP